MQQLETQRRENTDRILGARLPKLEAARLFLVGVLHGRAYENIFEARVMLRIEEIRLITANGNIDKNRRKIQQDALIDLYHLVRNEMGDKAGEQIIGIAKDMGNDIEAVMSAKL